MYVESSVLVVLFGGDAEFDAIAWRVKLADERFCDGLLGRWTP